MTLEEARSAAMELNRTGKHCKDWYYYIILHDGGQEGKAGHRYGKWFVMRRPKRTEVRTAVFVNGKLSITEK